MMFKKLFADMKFQRKMNSCYTMQRCWCRYFHALASSNVIEVMGGNTRYQEINSRINDYAIKYEMTRKLQSKIWLMNSYLQKLTFILDMKGQTVITGVISVCLLIREKQNWLCGDTLDSSTIK